MKLTLKQWILTGLGILPICFSSSACAQEAQWSAVKEHIRLTFPDVPQISADSLASILSDSTFRPVLLDVRASEEYAVSHLPNAIQVDPSADASSLPDTLSADTPLVLYCSVGYRSSEYAAKLKEAGFTNVSNLDGSIFEWANAGYPVVRNDSTVHQVHPYDRIWGRLLDNSLHAYLPPNP